MNLCVELKGGVCMVYVCGKARASKLFIFLRLNFSIWNGANDNPNFH